MAATRLSDSQKTELVARFRAGESSQALADAYGCSANTVSRVVKAALDPSDYEQLKQSRSRRPGRSGEAEPVAQGEQVAAKSAVEPSLLDPPAAWGGGDGESVLPISASSGNGGPGAAEAVDLGAVASSGGDAAAADDDPGDDDPSDDDGPAVLAIDDADDFGDDDEEDFADEDTDDAAVFIPIAVSLHVDDSTPLAVLPFRSADLPTSAYMLVDKTVELQPRPLSEFPEFAGLAAEELQRQALTIYPNPRQAKRQCGRTQRVIKLPDLSLLERTAPYLLAQGISRVVIESTAYALPDS